MDAIGVRFDSPRVIHARGKKTVIRSYCVWENFHVDHKKVFCDGELIEEEFGKTHVRCDGVTCRGKDESKKFKLDFGTDKVQPVRREGGAEVVSLSALRIERAPSFASLLLRPWAGPGEYPPKPTRPTGR